MRFWHRMSALWRNLARKEAVERDLDAEIRSYQGMLEDEKVHAGMDRFEARRAVVIDTGVAERIKEEVRSVRLGSTLEAMWSELRQSLRGLRRNPGLTLLGIATLGLGMGASTVVFSFFHTTLIQPLPFRETDRLVQLWETRQHRGIDQASFTEANFWDVRARSRSFSEVAAIRYGEANLTGAGPAEKVRTLVVTAGLFRTLGVSPVLGRDFLYEEEREGQNRVAIMGNRFWTTRFHGDRNILGKTVRLNDQAYTVIGVLPAGEPWINEQLYLPFGYRADANRGSWEYDVIARLAPGATRDSARADLQQIGAALAQTYPAEDKGIGFRLEPSSRWAASDSARRALSVLLGAVLFLLLIACLNVANLLLARGTARQREIAIRTALGAGRTHLVRFVMMESLLLSVCGAALGLALAYGGIHAIQALEVRGIPRLAEAGLTPGVLGFAIAMALLTGVLAGLAPAWQAPSRAIANVLRDGERQTGSRGQGRMRMVLITGEVALSFLLLAGAGLLIRSFVELVTVNRGFQTENRLVFSVSLPDSYYAKGLGKQFIDRFLERITAAPEVVAAGAVSHRPVEGGNPGMSIDSNAHSERSAKAPWSGWRVVTPGYFRAAGLPLLRGRLFDGNDRPVWAEPNQPAPPRRVLISERLAKLLYPNEDAVGKHVVLWKGQANLDAEVIGVVGDSLERGLTAGPALTVYIAYGRYAPPTEFVVHTRGNPLAIAPTVRSIVAGLDPNLPVADVRSFNDVVHRSVALQQFNAILLAVFGGLALLLATTGIYGVLSYAVSRQTSEIGLRAALGASRVSILRMTIGHGLRPALCGVCLGAAGAWWLSRYVASLLFGVQPFDAPTYAAVAALLVLTAVLACYVPGRRAMRIDPAVALRTE